ncbi:MAG: DUF5916 domain-containing protein [Bacteroidota bacterium]
MKQLYLIILLFFASLFGLSAQNGSSISTTPYPDIRLIKTNEKIKLDGILDEAIWVKCGRISNFWQFFPTDSARAGGQTEILMTYDENNIYVATKCYSSDNQFLTPTLKRDYGFRNSDNISILFDTFNDQTNAFLFGMNPEGVRREALISGGGRERSGFDNSWDNKWDGDAKIYEDYWIAEFAIPFKTIRYTEGSTRWRFNSYRNDTQINEITSWINVPMNNILMDLTYMGNMIWDEPLKKPSTNISVIPYVAGSTIRDFENVEQSKAVSDFAIGGDAKIAVTSGLNLDLTVNPDFSQVEVDQQVTNLDRFEIFFPERRQFFLENADLFGDFGPSRANPFFSRRIGVTIDTATGQNIQNTILYGARLSGKINNKLRVGLLNMQTAKQLENDLPSFNYTVAAVEQQVFKRSNIAFMGVNKQAINADDFSGSFNSYNRVAGLEYRLASADNYWTGKANYFQAFTPSDEEQKFTHFAQLIYNRRKYRLEWAQLLIGEGYNAEVGFVPRRDIFLVSPEASLNFFPEDGPVAQHTVGFDARWIYKMGKDDNLIQPDFGLADAGAEFFWNANFKSTAELNVVVEYNRILLLDDFDPTRIQKEGIVLPAGNIYKYTNLGVSYSSNQFNLFEWQVEPNIGQFYNGFRTGVEGSFIYKFPPFGSIAVDYSYNHINLDAPFERANLWLVGPKIDLTFSKKLFFTTFVQYNNQFDNLNINARFQWRFKPVSDFFLVYTDNYLTNPFDQFSVRNRALVAKLTYWLNL